MLSRQAPAAVMYTAIMPEPCAQPSRRPLRTSHAVYVWLNNRLLTRTAICVHSLLLTLSWYSCSDILFQIYVVEYNYQSAPPIEQQLSGAVALAQPHLMQK